MAIVKEEEVKVPGQSPFEVALIQLEDKTITDKILYRELQEQTIAQRASNLN